MTLREKGARESTDGARGFGASTAHTNPRGGSPLATGVTPTLRAARHTWSSQGERGMQREYYVPRRKGISASVRAPLYR